MGCLVPAALVQCAFEGLTAHSRFAALLRLAVPIGFNAYRLIALGTWLGLAFGTVGIARGLGESAWALGALALAGANVLLWSYNLFVFLLLRVVPQYLEPTEFPTPSKRWRWELLPGSAETEE